MHEESSDNQARREASDLIHGLLARRMVPDADGVAEIASAMHEYRRTPITEDCPVRCLGLSIRTYNRLLRGYPRMPEEAPATVGDLITLLRADRLRDFMGIGPRAIGEIEAALVFAGLHLGNHRH